MAGPNDTSGAPPPHAHIETNGRPGWFKALAALVKQGVDAARIATATGGQSDPVGSNAATSGQAENRRTELVVPSR